MKPPAHTLAAPAPSQDCDWTPLLTVGLGRSCPSCRPFDRERGPNARRWLEATPALDTRRLALACTLLGYEEYTATIERASALTRRARLRAQQLFPYGIGPVLGDLMLPADGGGDMLRALTDVIESIFARRRPPRAYPLCPRGSTDGSGCGRDPFGRRLHDYCRTSTEPVPAWRAKSWAVWSWRTACAVDHLPDHLLQHRRPQPVDVGSPGRIEFGMIGPITLLIGRDGPAQRAQASRSALTALVLELKPADTDVRTALFRLHDHLKAPRGGPFVWGWRGYAPRSLFAAALQARHTSLHHRSDDVLIEHLTRYLDLDRRRKRVPQGLLEEGWDEQVHTDEELEAQLRAAVHAAASADTELWERTVRHRRVVPLDDADLIAGSCAVDTDPGLKEEVDTVLSKLSPAELKVAHCYAQTGMTWKQAALKAGQEEAMGETVRRKLKRQGKEFLRRRK